MGQVRVYAAGVGASDMMVFDGLPRVVRDALQSTVRKWTAEAAREALDQGITPSSLAVFIVNMDANRAREDDLYH